MRNKVYEWQVIRLRARGEHLGIVKAVDEAAALKAAMKLFAASAEERTRLLVRRARRSKRVMTQDVRTINV